jgi:cyclase
MNRRSFVRSSALTIGALTIAQQKILATFAIDPWKITMLNDNMGIFTEKGGTILFLLSKTGIVVVDSQFPDSAQHCIDELKKKSSKPFSMLINTHHHGDHSSGNIAFKGLVTHVVAHINSKINQEAVAKQKNNEDKQLYPDQTYDTAWETMIDKEKIMLHYFGAGHTNGDSLVHFQHANIVHMGDLVFNRRHPFVDKTAGASISNWITILDKAPKTFDANTQYICGHSGTGYDVILKADDLKAFGEYLGNVLKFTEASIKAGKTKEELITATGIPGSPEWKGDGIDRPLAAAYTELTTK